MAGTRDSMSLNLPIEFCSSITHWAPSEFGMEQPDITLPWVLILALLSWYFLWVGKLYATQGLKMDSLVLITSVSSSVLVITESSWNVISQLTLFHFPQKGETREDISVCSYTRCWSHCLCYSVVCVWARGRWPMSACVYLVCNLFFKNLGARLGFLSTTICHAFGNWKIKAFKDLTS